jgi:hypothetical protein
MAFDSALYYLRGDYAGSCILRDHGYEKNEVPLTIRSGRGDRNEEQASKGRSHSFACQNVRGNDKIKDGSFAAFF